LVFALIAGCTGLKDDGRKPDRDGEVIEGGAAGAAGDAGDAAAAGDAAKAGSGGMDASMDGSASCQPGVFDDSRFDQACFQ
jgi:hypothetical protein